MTILLLVGVATLFFGAGVWTGMRTMGRNLDRVLAAFTPEQLRILAQRVSARRPTE